MTVTRPSSSKSPGRILGQSTSTPVRGASMNYRILLAFALTITGCTDAAAPPLSPDNEQLETSAAKSAPTATSLPTFGGGGVADAINDAGVIVGAASDPNISRTEAGAHYPVKWVRNAETRAWGVTKLGPAGARGLALNEAGDVVGIRDGKATVWPATGGEVDFGTGVAEGINGDLIIVGASEWGGRLTTVAYVWTPNGTSPQTWTRQTLPLLEAGGGASASAINQSGFIAGGATRGGVYRAVIWVPQGGGWSAPVPRDGTDASTGSSAAFSINANGDVAGYARLCAAPCSSHPFVWPITGGSHDLATLKSNVNSGIAWGIANEGQVVGFVTVTRGSGDGPFVWMGGTTLTDLGTGEANDINNRTSAYGQEAVGFSRTSKGQVPAVWPIP